MKITIFSKLLIASALTFSLGSFTSDKKLDIERSEIAKREGFEASLFQLTHTQKVKLAINKGNDSFLRVILRDAAGVTYYNELYANGKDAYRRTFDLADMTDGTYHFDLFYKDHKLTKTVELRTSKDKIIILQ
jgi:hypothetical protein